MNDFIDKLSMSALLMQENNNKEKNTYFSAKILL